MEFSDPPVFPVSLQYCRSSPRTAALLVHWIFKSLKLAMVCQKKKRLTIERAAFVWQCCSNQLSAGIPCHILDTKTVHVALWSARLEQLNAIVQRLLRQCLSKKHNTRT